jgi:hypothetical protein
MTVDVVIVAIFSIFIGSFITGFVCCLGDSCDHSRPERSDVHKINFTDFQVLYMAAPECWDLRKKYVEYGTLYSDNVVHQMYVFSFPDNIRYKNWLKERDKSMHEKKMNDKIRMVTEAQLKDIERWKKRELKKGENK